MSYFRLGRKKENRTAWVALTLNPSLFLYPSISLSCSLPPPVPPCVSYRCVPPLLRRARLRWRSSHRRRPPWSLLWRVPGSGA